MCPCVAFQQHNNRIYVKQKHVIVDKSHEVAVKCEAVAISQKDSAVVPPVPPENWTAEFKNHPGDPHFQRLPELFCPKRNICMHRSHPTKHGTSHINYETCEGQWQGLGYVSRYSESLRAGRTRDQIPVGARFFVLVQTGPGAHPASCTMGTGPFPGVKRPGHVIDHPPPSSAEVKKE
jgi:hypothetical protein